MQDIVIAGGGYAGVAAARALGARPDVVRVTIVDASPAHELLTRLPEVVSGEVAPHAASLPFRDILPRNTRLVRGRITDIDPADRRLSVAGEEIRGDVLVVTLGSAPGFHGIPGAEEHGCTLRSVAGALHLRRRLQGSRFTSARPRVVIIGAGYSGTEVAGECASWPGGLHVTLLAPDSRMLPHGNERLATIARQTLEQKGVRIILGTGTAAVEERNVLLTDGNRLPADVVVWAAPSVAPPPVRAMSHHGAGSGKLVVDSFLRVSPWENVYAAGDAALIPDSMDGLFLPSSAQVATLAGRHIGETILREQAGSAGRVFQPTLLGEAVSLGGRDGVAEVLGVVVTGRRALAVKQAALGRYLWHLGGAGLARRARAGEYSALRDADSSTVY